MTPSDQRLLSLLSLCAGLMLNLGQFSLGALLCVLVSVAVAASSLRGKRLGPPLPLAGRVVVIACLAALMLLYPGTAAHPVFPIVVAAIVTSIVVFAVSRRRAVRLAAATVAAGASCAGLAANLTWGSVGNDVFGLQQTAAQALLSGQNPYAPTVPSIQVVAPSVAAPIDLHFPYGPSLPILEAPFRLLGDVRVLHVLTAVLTVAVVVILARRAGTLDVTACLLMAFPLTIGMIIFSWIDVISMAGFSTWLVLHRSHPRIATVALAIALAARPTTLIALVPIVFWSIRARRQVVIAGALATLIVLPFLVATGYSAFYHDLVGVFLAVFPRFDSLTVNSFLHSVGLPILPAAASSLVVGATMVAVLRKRPDSYGDLMTASAVIVTVAFLVAKWAYFNYYYNAAVLLVMAVAGDGLELDAAEMIRPPAPLLIGADFLRRRFPRSALRRLRPGGALHGRPLHQDTGEAAPQH